MARPSIRVDASRLLLFLLGQGWAWRQLAASGIFVATNPSSSFFYLLTAAHGLHILGGLTALVYVDVEALKAPFADVSVALSAVERAARDSNHLKAIVKTMG